MSVYEDYKGELEKILPKDVIKACERSIDSLKHYEKPSQYLFHSQSNLKFLEDLFRDRVNKVAPKFCWGFVFGNFAVDKYPKSYVTKVLADNIIKETIITGTFGEYDGFGKKPNTLVLRESLLADYQERGDYIEAGKRTAAVFKAIGREFSFIVFESSLFDVKK